MFSLWYRVGSEVESHQGIPVTIREIAACVWRKPGNFPWSPQCPVADGADVSHQWAFKSRVNELHSVQVSVQFELKQTVMVTLWDVGSECTVMPYGSRGFTLPWKLASLSNPVKNRDCSGERKCVPGVQVLPEEAESTGACDVAA